LELFEFAIYGVRGTILFKIYAFWAVSIAMGKSLEKKGLLSNGFISTSHFEFPNKLMNEYIDNIPIACGYFSSILNFNIPESIRSVMLFSPKTPGGLGSWPYESIILAVSFNVLSKGNDPSRIEVGEQVRIYAINPEIT
jgi:hypothetical protein